MNMITVKINGLEYNLKGDECNDYLQKVASYVDKKMEDLMNNNDKLSVSASAVLTALNSVDEMFKMQAKYKELLEGVKYFEKDQQGLKEQIEYLKKQIKHLEEYNNELQNKLNSTEITEKHEDTTKNEEIIDNLKEQIVILEESAKSYIEDKNRYKLENKELKFQLHSAKYKLIDLENKLIENQIHLAETKKNMENISIKKSK